MKILYLDCFSGISGNMLLGALVAVGCPVDRLNATVAALGFPDTTLRIESVDDQGLAATQVTVTSPPDQPSRNLHDIERILEAAALDDKIADLARKAFHNLARAEAKVHGTTEDSIHFHEVGAVDAMVDIVGSCAAVLALGVDQVVCSPLPLGHGTVDCAHGTLPVPVPATLALLEKFPTYPADRPGEHVTPTGAVLATTLADRFGRLPAGQILQSGFGAGTRRFESGPPNLLRAMLIEARKEASGQDDLVIETNIDDMNPEFYGPLVHKLFEAGALDVTLTPCYMKKGRPGTLVSVIGGKETLDAIARVLFSDSTTIGLRVHPVARIVCDRTWREVSTPFGTVRIKVSRYLDRIVGAKPEFEDCVHLAETHQVSVQEVYQAALAAYRRQE